MDRRQFLRLCAVLGIAGPLAGSCGQSEPTGEFGGTVIVIGAGAAGMSAGYFLARQGVDVRIFEAAATHGGRIKQAVGFVDFPIPLGGEWLHRPESELARIVGVDEPTIPMQGYGPEDLMGYWDGALTTEPMDWEDFKFIGSTWLGLFDRFIVPTIEPYMEFDRRAVKIDYSGELIEVATADGATHEADRVIVTVPIRALRDDLRFVPDLPDDKQSALREADVWSGMKVFVEFSERFYPAALTFPDSITPTGQRIYYDAAHGQDTESNVMGLFSVGTGAERYQAQPDDEQLRALILAELDEVFDGAASRTYVQHIAQNWADEPFIGMAYLADVADWQIPGRLFDPIEDRLYFAGEAYNDHDDWGSVHDAARAARTVVERILN